MHTLAINMSGTVMGYGRQVSFGEDPNRWNFKSDRDFRTLAATVYQSEV